MSTNSRRTEGDQLVATIGTFDGVHRGHQFLISRVIERARDKDQRALVVTFEPVPVSVLRPEVFQGRICGPVEKFERLRACGIDQVEVVQFTRELAARTAEEFVSDLIARLPISEIWVGNDFALGRNRAGDVNTLRSIGVELGFDVVALERLESSKTDISSTQIRLAVQRGDIALANELLGRPFRVSGEIIHGAHLGRTIGYPTANFAVPEGIVQLADGIYVSIAYLDNLRDPLLGMTYMGTRPTVDGIDRQIETHLFDFDSDIYGRTLKVDILERTRADRQFDSLDGLIEQLGRDELEVRERLANRPALARSS